jgi:hypothetical protein
MAIGHNDVRNLVTGNDDRLLRIPVTGAMFYACHDGVTFIIHGVRFRKDQPSTMTRSSVSYPPVPTRLFLPPLTLLTLSTLWDFCQLFQRVFKKFRALTLYDTL